MAFLRELTITCWACNKAKATVELFGLQNESYGKYCRACAAIRLKSKLKSEDNERKRQHEDYRGKHI